VHDTLRRLIEQRGAQLLLDNHAGETWFAGRPRPSCSSSSTMLDAQRAALRPRGTPIRNSPRTMPGRS
jgi:hypothetical protein